MTRWSGVVLRRPWLVLLLAAGLVVVAGAWGSAVGDRLGTGGYADPGSESMQVEELVEQHFGRQSPDVVAVYTAPPGTSLDDIGPRVQAQLDTLDPTLLSRPVVTPWNTPAAAPYLRSVAGDRALALVFAAGDENQRLASYAAIADDLIVPGVPTELTGFAAVADSVNTRSERDLLRAEALSLPLTLLVLVLVFGGLVAAALPVAVGVLAILGALACLRVVSTFAEVNVFAVNIATLLSLGLAIDYGLFVVSRYREELEGADPATALPRTLATAGRTIAFSALLLVCAFAGTLVFPQASLRSLGFGAMAAVATAAAMSLTVLPAALALLGHRIGAGSWRRDAFGRGQARAARFWDRVTRLVLARRVLVATSITAVLLVLAVPVLGVKLTDIDHTALPAGDPARVAVERVAAEFPAAGSGVVVVARGTDGRAPAAIAVEGLRREIAEVDDVAAVVVAGTRDDVTLLRAQLSVPDRSQPAMAVLDRIRAIDAPDGVDVLLGGESAVTADGVDAIVDRFPLMVAIMALATFVLLLIAFGSVLLPVKAVLVAALSLGATFGILTWVFQDGHLAGALGVSTGPLAAGMAVLVVAVVFGLSTDYEVFLISRMVEEHRRGGDTDAAVLAGAVHTGRVVTAAAALLILVTGAFTLSSLTPMRFLGIGMIVALVIDATLVRMLLVPALVALMGRANWWPWAGRTAGPLRPSGAVEVRTRS
ncbi:MMPL family transporter [Rhodococcus gannanensis]|uniref:MMPL family transporter n=1 Tax=Rhodococcus gannanensis TaxID=1960308 RepID=A0ABW4P2C3_9NOCA